MRSGEASQGVVRWSCVDRSVDKLGERSHPRLVFEHPTPESLHSRATHGRSQASTTDFRDPRRSDRSVLDRCRIDRASSTRVHVFGLPRIGTDLPVALQRNRRAPGAGNRDVSRDPSLSSSSSRKNASRRGTSPVSRRPRCPRAGGMGQVRQVVPVRGLGGGRRPRRVRQAVSRCRRPGGRPRRRRTEQGTLGVGRCR